MMSAGNREQAGPRGALQALLAWTVLLGLLCSTVSCGFHPRGSSALPPGMAVTYIRSGQPYGSLVDDFSAALRDHGGQVTTVRGDALAILNLVSNTIEKRVLSVDTAGKVLEYETRQTIRFSVVTSENLPLVEEQEVSMANDYLYTTTETLSKEREDRSLRRVLQRNLVELALLRIVAVAR